MEIYFKRCTIDDFEDFYLLKSDEENILWTGHKSAPDKCNLKDWYKKQLAREDRIMFLAKSTEANETVGYLYLDIVGENNDIIETGHGVHSKYKGKGLGTKIIAYAVKYTKENLNFIRQIDGWIATSNIGSIRNVLKNGYEKVNETKNVFFEGFDKQVEMQKFIYKITR